MSAYVHPSVKIGKDFVPAPFCIIDEDVVIGDNVTVGSFVRICAGSVLGDDVTVAEGAIVGKRPRLAKGSTAKGGALPGVVLGRGCSVGSNALVMAGSTFGEECVIADGAGVRERCAIGDNVVIGRNVTVENDTSIGSRTRIQSGAYVTAYVTIEEDVFIAPMVVTTNDNYMGRTEKRLTEMRGCTIRRGARVGGGAHILPGIEIGEDSFVATASIVTRDVPPRTLVMGAPARPVRSVPEEELLENQ